MTLSISINYSSLRIFISCLIYLLLTQISYATDWQTLTQQVINNDPRVLSAEAKLKASHADIDGAWGAYYPKIRGIGSAGISDSSDSLTRDGNKHTIGLEIEQPIPIFGHESAEVDAAEAAAQIEVATLKQIQQSVAAEFLETILRLRNAEKIWQLQQQLSSLLNKQHQALKEALAGGGIPLPQLHQAQSRLSQANAKQQQSKSEVQFLHTRLMRLIPDKRNPELISDAELSQLFKQTPTELGQAFELAAKISPILLKAQAELAQAQAEKDAASADYWPKLSLNVQGQTGTFGESSATSTSAFFNITQPIFEGGATVAKADSAGYKLEATRELIRQEQRMLQERIQDAWMRWNNYQKSVLFWQKAITNEDEAVNLIREQVNNGVGTRISLMEATEEWMEIRKEALEQTLERDIAWLHLFTETGGFFYQPPPSENPSL